MSFSSRLFERARFVKHRVHERVATAKARWRHDAQHRPAHDTTFIEQLEQRVLLTGAIGAIPDLIDPNNAEQVVYAPGSSVHTISADPGGPSSLYYKFAVDGTQFENSITFNLLPSIGSGDDAALALYDESGNLIQSVDADPAPGEPGAESLVAEINSGLAYILGVYFAPAGPPNNFTLIVGADPQTLNTPITIDPDTGTAHLDANTGEDTFNTPTDVDFYELNMFNGGPGGTVTVTPTGLDVKVFATVFRRDTPTGRWTPIDTGSDMNGGPVTLTLTPPTDKNLHDAQYMLAVAPLDYHSAARSYEIDVSTTSQVVPVDITSLSITEDFHSPVPFQLGLGRVVHADSLAAGNAKAFKFRAPADTTGQAKIKLQPTGFEPVLSVYDETGTILLDLATMTATGDVELSLPVTSSDAYLIRVGDIGNDSAGSFTLTVETPYTTQPLALNPLVGDASVTTLNGLTVGQTLGASVYRITPAVGVDVLAFELGTAGPTGAKIALRGSNLALMTKEVAPGQTLFFPVNVAGVPGPIDVYIVGTSPGTDTATLKIGQVNIPHELDLDDLRTEKLDFNGDLNSSFVGGAFGKQVGEKHYQVVTDPNSSTIIFGDGLTGAVPTTGQPILAQYRQSGSTQLDLVGFVLPTDAGPATIDTTLTQDSVYGFIAIAMDFNGTDTIRIDVNGPDADFVGVGMVPEPTLQLPDPPGPPNFDPNPIVQPPPPYFSVLKIRDIQFEHDFEQHLWRTLLPFNMKSNAVPQVTLKSNSNANTSPFFGATVTVMDENMNVLKSAINFPGGPVLTINLDNINISQFQGQPLHFKVEPLQNQLLNDGFYTLEMEVETDNPFPFLVTETAWKTFGSSPTILPADMGNVGSLPLNESVKNIIQNQFGDGSFTSSFTSSLPFDSGLIGNTGSIDVFRFWVETPGPVTVRTVPLSETVNTSIKLYQPRFNSDGTVRYFGQIPDVAPSFDWFPADRSQIDAQSYINDFDILAFDISGSNLMREDYPYGANSYSVSARKSGGFYYAVVKNEQGTKGQYRIEVDAPNFPLLGNFEKTIPTETVTFNKALTRGELTYFQPIGGSATLSSGVAFTESIAEFAGYYPLAIPDYHGGELDAKGNFFSGWTFEAFDHDGNQLPKTTFLSNDPAPVTVSRFSLPSGPQTVYLRVQENGAIANSLADVALQVSSQRFFPIGFFAPPTTLPSSSTTVLPADPLGNGSVTSVFNTDGQSQAFSFRAPAGQLTVNVGQHQADSMRLRWGVYVDGQRIAWDQTNFAEDTSLFGIPTEGTTTVVTLPDPRPPLDNPDYFYDSTAGWHDVVVYVQSLDDPSGSGQYTISVETEAEKFLRAKRLVMDPISLSAMGSVNGVSGNEWVRLDVPDDVEDPDGLNPPGFVDLTVELNLALPFSVSVPVRVDLYDLEGNLLSSTTKSTVPGSIPPTVTFTDLEGTLPGNSYYMRASYVFNTPVTMNLKASAYMPKAFFPGKPPATRDLFDIRLHRMILTPEEGVGNIAFGSLWDSENPNLVFASGFWVNEAGLAQFSGKINGGDSLLDLLYVALYKVAWTGSGEFPFDEIDYELNLVDYTNHHNVDSLPSGDFYRFQTNVEPGFYVILGESREDSDFISTGGSIFVNLEDYEAPETILDPNFGMSLLPQYWETTHEGTTDGFGNHFTPKFDHMLPGFRTSYYKMTAPPGSQAAMLASGVNLPLNFNGSPSLNREARVHIWYQNDSGFFNRDGDPKTGDPLNINAVDPPNHSIGNAMSDVDAKPGQTFWIGLHRAGLDTKIGLGALFIVPFSGDPDLATETPQFSPNNGETRVDITVRNLGFAPALFFDRRYQFTDTSKNPDHTTISDKQELPIGPLGSRSFVYDWVPVRPEDSVEYFADFTNLITESDELNNDAGQFLYVVDPTRPTVSLSLQDPLMDGNTAANIWGRYITGVTGASTNVIITANDPDGDLYQTVGRHPFLSGFPSQDGQFYSASVSGSNDTSNINFVDFGKFEFTSPQNPNRFKMRARDAFGLLSDETVVTAQVEQFPGWLDNEDSELTFDPTTHKYNISFRNALVDWGPQTVSQLVGFTVPFIGDKENQVLAEIKAVATAGLNPNTAIVVPVTARALVRILGEDVINETWTGQAQATDHFSIATNLQINSQSLSTDWLSVSFLLEDYPLFHWESPEITLFSYGVPNVASINAYLQFIVDAMLSAGVTIAIDPALLQNPLQVPEILGLTTPTFVAPTITPGIEIGGEIEILGFDLASISGSIFFGFTPALGFPQQVQNQLIPFQDFFTVACLGATGELHGEISAEVLGFEVFSFDLPSANFNFNPACTVVMSSPLPATPFVGPLAAPSDFDGVTVFHGGDTPVGQIVIDPVPNIVIDPVTGQAMYVQLVDTDLSAGSTRNNLVFAQRTGGVWSSSLTNVAGGIELGKHISNPVLALTNDDTDAPAVVVYQAIDESGNVEALSRNDFLTGQDIRYRYFDGTNWGPELAVTVDSQYDTDHAVSFNSAGNGVLAWVHNTSATPLADSNAPMPGEMARDANEIHVSTWNDTTHTWGPTTILTTNNVSDSKPTVFAGEDGTLYALWLRDTATGNQIMQSTNSGSGWSNPAVLPINGISAGKFTGLAIGSEAPGRVDVQFAHVTENPDLSAESRLYNLPTTIAGFAAPTAPELIAQDANFARLKTIKAPDGSMVTYWQQSDGVTIDVFASQFDATTSTWSRPFRLTDGEVEVTPSLAIDTDGTYQLVYEEQAFVGGNPSPAPEANAPAGAPSVGVPTAGNVGTSSTAMLPEFSFSRRINFPGADKAPGGALVAADAQIINRGPVGDEVLVEYIIGDLMSPTDVESETIFLGPGSRYDVNHLFQIQPGDTQYSIRLTALGGAEVVGTADNVTTTTISGVPDIIISDVTLSNPNPVEGETVTVTVDVTNRSRQKITTPFDIEYFQGDPDFTFAPTSFMSLGTHTLNALGSFDTESFNFQWTVPTGGGNFVLTAIADSGEIIDEVTDNNNKGQSNVAVIRPDAAAVGVVAQELNYSGIDNVEVTATITNRGRATINNLEIAFMSTYDDLFTPLDDPTLTYQTFDTQTIPTIMPGQTIQITGVGDGFAGINNYRVVVDPNMHQIDGNWSNNVEDTSLILQGLSDLTVEILGIDPDSGSSDPMAIKGDPLTIRTEVSNEGILPARDFKVDVFALNLNVGIRRVGTTTITELLPRTTISVDIPIDTSELLGDTVILVIVDLHDKVLELNEYNNSDSMRIVFKQAHRVVDRHVFYNNSSHDGNNSKADPRDDDAIATDKEALLPGETPSAENLTNYSRGTNGIMIDIDGLPGRNINLQDAFEFRVGNTQDPSTWDEAPEPRQITLRRGEGENGSDRVTVIWDDAAITNKWLQVTVKAENTGIPTDDIFYFGNLIADATGDGRTNGLDLLAWQSELFNTGDNLRPDFDKNQLVNGLDLLSWQANLFDTLEMDLITDPSQSAPLTGEDDTQTSNPPIRRSRSRAQTPTETAPPAAASAADNPSLEVLSSASIDAIQDHRAKRSRTPNNHLPLDLMKLLEANDDTPRQ